MLRQGRSVKAIDTDGTQGNVESQQRTAKLSSAHRGTPRGKTTVTDGVRTAGSASQVHTGQTTAGNLSGVSPACASQIEAVTRSTLACRDIKISLTIMSLSRRSVDGFVLF